MRWLIAAAMVALISSNAHAQMTDEQRNDAVMKLDWKRGGSHKLAASNSTLSVPSDHMVVIGADAVRFEELIGNKNNAGLEAVTVNGNDEEIIFESVREGYVSIEDWNDVDAKAMMTSVTENTEKANAERVREGFEPIHVIGWVQQPVLDRTTSTVYWAIAATQGNHKLVNSRALRLGRHGFELLTWVGTGDQYKAVGGDLDVMLRSFSFEPGSRYGDFTSGDKVAAYTIGGLVATLAGAKLIKVAAAGGLLLLLKKFGVVIIAVFAGLLAKLRSFFRRKPSTPVGAP